jgi:hypothetical protein
MHVAVVVPKNRLWHWHDRLIRHLGNTHAVEVFQDDHAPPYPFVLRAWLKTELAIYGQRMFPESGVGVADGPALPKLNPRDFDIIVNLSEHARPGSKSIAIGYDGATDSTVLIDGLLARRTPYLTVFEEATRKPLAQSRPAIDDKSRLTRGLQLSFARCISLVGRAIKRTGRQAIVAQPPQQFARGPGLPAFIGRFIREKVSRVALRRAEHWSVAVRRGTGPFIAIADDARRYYADPFLFDWRGRNFLLVEEFSYAEKKGVISAAEIIGDRLVRAPAPVLERPYHLSYPFVLADGDNIYMLPETTANKTLELYRAIEFPSKWQLDRVLIEGLCLADATPLFHRGRWWLFAAAAEHGSTDRDELVIFYSDKLTGPWRPHRKNPVKSDCRSARPAGRILRQGARLLRPAQDCEDGYGAGLTWLEITELTPDDFHEEEIVRWSGTNELGVAGIHSFDQIGQVQAIDFKSISGLGIQRPAPCQLTLRSGSPIGSAFPTADPLTSRFGARERRH